MEIRTASANELPAMLAMEARYTENAASLESFRETFEAHPDLFVVCADDGDIVGEASGRVEDDAVILESIAVTDDRQGDGIGRRVLECFEERAEEVGVAKSTASETLHRVEESIIKESREG